MDLNSIFFISKWWFALFALGFLNLPITYVIFKKFLNFGYAFSKLIAILLSSYLLFLLSTAKIIPFDFYSILISLVPLFIINIYLFNKHKDEIKQKLQNFKFEIAIEEILFTFGLFFWAYVRGHQPDIEGLEKFMDYGFVNSILQSDYLPPTDMWFAGKSINYYWFGHYLTAFLTKITSIPSKITYNLMLATIMGFGLSQAFSLVYGLTKSVAIKSKTPIIAGVVSAIVLIFAGNFHTPYFVFKNGGDKYWYPDATRFIGYNPDVPDKTIHEFPLYSFVVADLHGHLLNFPIVILYVALLVNYFVTNKDPFAPKYELGFFSFLLGIMFMTNTWDFANYLLLTGACYFLFLVRSRAQFIKNFFNGVISGVIVIITGILTALPFVLNFESIAQGVKLTHTHSQLWQLAILWGFPGILTVVFAVFVFFQRKKLKSEDILIGAFAIAGWILIVLPEFIYVKDIYIASHYRANTMFKLTYQAFVMFYLCSGYIIFRVLTSIRPFMGKVILSIYFATILSSLMIYPYYAIKSYYGKLNHFKTLDGESWLANRLPEQKQVINWLRDNANGNLVILEAPGDSYTLYNVVSSYTGLPTVSGWFVHEWLWRGEAIYPQQRVTDITTIYTSENISDVSAQIKKYKIVYIIVGPNEREKFPTLTEAKFEKVAKLRSTFGNTKIYQVN